MALYSAFPTHSGDAPPCFVVAGVLPAPAPTWLVGPAPCDADCGPGGPVDWVDPVNVLTGQPPATDMWAPYVIKPN
jgi:hypothetical protein